MSDPESPFPLYERAREIVDASRALRIHRAGLSQAALDALNVYRTLRHETGTLASGCEQRCTAMRAATERWIALWATIATMPRRSDLAASTRPAPGAAISSSPAPTEDHPDP